MRHIIWMTILILSFFGITNTHAQDDTTPAITTFSSTLTTIDGDALVNRSARIPVSWQAVNRPLLANLIFEQILPDDSIINVELPRIIPWVNSSGNGITAPILPSNTATAITLRVRLTNIITSETYDEKTITLTIADNGSGSGGTDKIPTIQQFKTGFTGKINPEALAAGNIQLPVNWQAINRPVTANLVFEQILPDNTTQNVELPRSNPWVNSEGTGTIAPVNPGEDMTSITVRVRLVDLLYGRIYDQRTITIPIAEAGDNSPKINTFSTTRSFLDRTRLQNETELVDVAWSVANRPANSNLVFEQILQDGSVFNAELPRDFTYVASPGNGVVSLRNPGAGVDDVTFRVRLIDTQSNVTLDTATLSLPILQPDTDTDDTPSNSGNITVTGDACYQVPFPPGTGLSPGDSARVLTFSNGIALDVYDNPHSVKIGSLETGTTFTIEEGLYCVHDIASPDTYHTRFWQIAGDNISGWVQEYAINAGRLTRHIADVSADDNTLPQIVSFTVSPDTLQPSDITDDTMITLTWATGQASQIWIYSGEARYENLPAEGTLTIPVTDLDTVRNPIPLVMYVQDNNYNTASVESGIPVNTEFTIESFTVSPDSALIPGNVVTLTWNINGTLSDESPGSIWWTPEHYRFTLNTVTTVETSSGSVDITIPESVYGERVFTLYAHDETGTRHEATASINVDCPPVDFIVSDPEIQADNCAHPALTTAAAYQNFENGRMIWTEANDMIYIIFNDGSAAYISDSWDGSTYTIEDSPPDGLRAPERGFGYLWATQEHYRNRLGWAIEQEGAYTATLQSTRAYTRYQTTYTYLTLTDGRIIRINQTIDSSTWRTVN